MLSRISICIALATACSFPEKHPTGDGGTADAATPFGCAGRPFGTSAAAQIMISGQALDLGTGVPGANIEVRGVLDSGTTLFTRTTDSTGSFSALVTTGGTALVAQIVTTAGAYVPSYFIPAHPFNDDAMTPLPVLTPAELVQVGNPANTALAQFILVDCLGNRLEGCTLTMTPAPQRLLYARNGMPDPAATSTDRTGYVLVYGLPPGTASFTATCPQHGDLRPTSRPVVGDSMYFIAIGP